MADDEVERVRSFYVERTEAVGDKWDARRPSQVEFDACRRRVWSESLSRLDHDMGRVLEIGCGTGSVSRWALEVGATLTVGIDLQAERLTAAAGRRRAGETYTLADGRHIPFPDSTFDTVLCSLVVSNFLDTQVRTDVLSEVVRVLRPRGAVLYFDLARDSPTNRHIRGLRLREVRSLLPDFVFRGQRVVLAPPIARRLEMRSRLISALELVRPLRTHIAGVFYRPRR